MRIVTLFSIMSCCFSLLAQSKIDIQVNAARVDGEIEPLWGDHYEMHLLYGWGGNPYLGSKHQSFVDDLDFDAEMEMLKPRFIRVSTGRFENPPDTGSFSRNPRVLKNLWTEYYKGANHIVAADDLANYDFRYIDSLVEIVQATGAEVFLDMAYMLYALSSDTIPDYPFGPDLHLLAWDNSIRNAPAQNKTVYARVVYHLIKHLYTDFGVRYFEFWNEPDQTIFTSFFWKGNDVQLYEMYEALVKEIELDSDLSRAIEIGCCGFAFNSLFQYFPIGFLNQIKENKTRLDFLSFHPYSADQLGGYDTTKVNLATSWQKDYSPNAKLINSEWGILNAFFGSSGWNDLDYGLERAKAIIDMNQRNVKMAHQATFADTDETTATCCLGMFYVAPQFAPKPSAYVYSNLNKLLVTPRRLASTITSGQYVIAGKSTSGDTIVIAYPSNIPEAETTDVFLQIQDLDWKQGIMNRFELTETSFAAKNRWNLTMSKSITDKDWSDQFSFSRDMNSGRLIIWELINTTSNRVTPDFSPSFLTIFPNPSLGRITIIHPMEEGHIEIFDSRGILLVKERVKNGQISFEKNLSKGIYFIRYLSNDGKIYRCKTVNILH